MPTFFSHVYPPLLRAGAFGTLWGGTPGEPRLGLCISVPDAEALQAALDSLSGTPKSTQATLLIAPALAQTHPELLRQAAEAGHEIAGTGSPEQLVWLEVLTGQQIRLWQVTPADLSPTVLARLAALDVRLLPLPAPFALAVRPGGIVQVAANDLAARLSEWRGRGYQPGPVRDLPALRTAAPRDLLHGLYLHWIEDRYAEREGLIETSDRYDAFLRVAALDHAPAPLPLPPHTPTAELHVHSERMVGLAAGGLMKTYKMYLRGLKDVARALQTDPRLADAQAVFAVSLFYGPLEKAGFTVLDLPPLRARWYGLGFRVLRLAYGTTQTPSAEQPKMAWMPREEFLRRFGSK